MPQLLIRNLDEAVVEKLKQNATSNHRSLQAEVQQILENAARVNTSNFWENAAQVREKLQNYTTTFSDSSDMIREDRES